MKELLKKIAAVPVIVLSVMSCNKETAPETAAETSKISISVKAEIDNLAACEDTKSSVAPVIRLTWENGDKVFVYGNGEPLDDYLTVSIEDDARYASLTGNFELPTNTTLTCVYAPGLKKAPAPDEYGKVTFPMDTQDPKSTPFVVYGTIDADKVNTPGQIVKFQFATAVVLVNCLGLEDNIDKKVTKAELSGIKTNCVIKLSGTGAPSVVEDENAVGTITSTGTFSLENGKSSFYFGVPVSSEVSVSRKLTVSQGVEGDDVKYTTSFTKNAFDAGQFKNVLYSLTKGYVVPEFGVDPDDYVEINGIYWAKNNLAVTASGKAAWKGANSSEVKVPNTSKGYCAIRGDYFQWAASYDGYGLTGVDRKPENLVIYREIYENNSFDSWGTISEFATGDGNSPYRNGGKYIKYTGSTDILSSDDDAASLCLENGWRMPTEKECANMKTATFWVFDEEDRGVYVFSPTGSYAGGGYVNEMPNDLDKSNAILFFPCAGFFSNESNSKIGAEAAYWSSSRGSSNPYTMRVISSAAKADYANHQRQYGLSIRPVKTKPTD